MCGIAGQIGVDRETQPGGMKAYFAMQTSMQRRGPDQRGMYVKGEAALIHARLCVIDVQNGRQPMQLACGAENYVLVYNGELYNTPELRAELYSLGHRFRGHSDTEILLHAYAEWGERCLEKLNGIFAFAVWEENAHRLFLARDRMGVKPLFYTIRGRDILFASELKTLLCHPLVPPDVDQNGLAEILLLGPGRTPGCGVFHEIQELLPGTYGYFFCGPDRWETHTYWRLTDHEHPDDLEHTVKKVRELVLDAIERQLVSDVPVCTFLSGGLDSSIISAVADQYFSARGQTLKTVSVGYRDNKKYFHASKFQPNADAPYIRRMNEVLRAEHHWITQDTPELVEALFPAVQARDLPGMADVDSSLLLFCGEIRKLGTVALSGECADEIFGGYPWYRDKEIRERDGFPWAQSTAYRASFLQPGVLGSIEPEAFVDERYRRTVEETSVLPGTDALETRMRQMMILNLKWFMQTLLDRKDRMSMYNGLEVRVPFCDYRIVEYMYSVPWAYKDCGSVEKGLLRRAMEGVLPDEVRLRRKSPYPKTWNPDYLAAVRARLSRILAEGTSPLLQLVKREALETLLTAEVAQPWYGQLMNTPQTIAYFLQMDAWLTGYHVHCI
jgi:asparagine synthase (glutamine-hydrolysing)